MNDLELANKARNILENYSDVEDNLIFIMSDKEDFHNNKSYYKNIIKDVLNNYFTIKEDDYRSEYVKIIHAFFTGYFYNRPSSKLGFGIKTDGNLQLLNCNAIKVSENAK